MKVMFGQKSWPKMLCTTFNPSAKDRREKINELQAIIFDKKTASDAQKFLAPPKRRILEKKSTPIYFRKKIGRWKMKCRESSETRFPKVSLWSEPCSRGKRPLKVWKKSFRHRKSPQLKVVKKQMKLPPPLRKNLFKQNNQKINALQHYFGSLALRCLFSLQKLFLIFPENSKQYQRPFL